VAGRPAGGGGADGGFQTLGRARGPRGPRPVAGAAGPAAGAASRGGPVTFASVAHAASPQAAGAPPAEQAPSAAQPDEPRGQGPPEEREPADLPRQAPGQAAGPGAGSGGSLQGFLTDAVQCAVPEPPRAAAAQGAPAPRADPGRPAAQAGGGAPADVSGWGAADDRAVAPAAGRAGPDGASAQQVPLGVGSAAALALHVAQAAACLLRGAPGWLGGAAGEALQGSEQLPGLQAGAARGAVGLRRELDAGAGRACASTVADPGKVPPEMIAAGALLVFITVQLSSLAQQTANAARSDSL